MIKPGYAEFGSVQQVNTDDYSIDVFSDSGRTFDRVLWASPWVSNDGAGMYAMPQIGSRVLLVYPDGSDRPVAVGWVPYRDKDGKFKGRKEDLRQGDMVMKTPDGAMVILRTGGLIEIFSNALNHWMFIPITNTTRGTTENLELITLGGKLFWRHDRDTRRTAFTALFKDEAIGDHKLQMEFGHIPDGSIARILYDDPDAQGGEGSTAQIRIGDLGDGHVLDVNVDNQIDVSLGKDATTGTLLRTNIAEGSQAVTVELGRNTTTGALLNVELNDGANTLEAKFGAVEGDALLAALNTDKWKLNIEPSGKTTLSVAGGNTTLEIDASGNIRLNTAGDVDADVAGHCYITNDDVKIGSKEAAEQLVLGNQHKAYHNSSLKTAYDAHQHIGNMGSPTGPPLSALPPMQDAELSDIARTEKS